MQNRFKQVLSCGLSATVVLCLLGWALNVHAALNATNLFPANGATNVCTDTPLKISFDAVPSIAKTATGKVRIYSAANVLVDTIDFSNATTNRSLGTITIDGKTLTNYGVIVRGNVASIYPHFSVMTTNQVYYVNIDTGLFTNNPAGQYAGIATTNAWRFATKPFLPPTGTNTLVVAADGSGDFCTVQGAVSFVPLGNTNFVLLSIHKGFYEEIVTVLNQNNLTFRGEDRKQTIITYTNNDSFNKNSTNRAVLSVQANDIILENLTLSNNAAKSGSSRQAETLFLEGDHCIMQHVDFSSYTDTLKPSGRVYFEDCYIEGDVDFIWGQGTSYFTNCEIKELGASGNSYTQPRSTPTNYGYIFVNCSLTKASGVNSNSHYLGRTLSGSNPTSSNGCAAYINCKMDNHIADVGWSNAGEPTGNLRYWEYQSTDLTGTNLVNVSSRASFSRQLNSTEAAQMQNLTNVLRGWLPRLAPYFIAQPTNQIVSSNQTATFIVSATGIPAPVYQWLKNGTNINGATNVTFAISNAQPADTAVYSVIVSNGVTPAASANATLIVNPLPRPQLGVATWSNGQCSLAINGVAGPVYSVQASTNLLTQWQTVFTTNSSVTPFTWIDSNTTGFAARYYRVQAN